VELVETHISYLFLTGAFVYKVKKPVDFGFLDFTTLEKRRHFCQQEVLLNRRLSPDVYLGLVEVRHDQGRYAIHGPGEAVEYAVKMRQLPRDRAMAQLLARGEVTPKMVQQLGQKVWAFHRDAAASQEITRIGGLDTVRRNVEENFAQTEEYVGRTISRELFHRVRAYSQAFLDARRGLFQQRAAEGRIRDCHGDLHTAQIFLVNGISIIDCIEFNERFRYSDVASDLAFLAMDLDHHRRPDLSRLLVQAYQEASGDTGLADVLDFYKCYRAYVRGKVTSFRLKESSLAPAQRRRAIGEARRYFALAASYAQLPGPFLLITAGLMGAGKSAVAQGLAGPLRAEVIASDVVRKEMAGLAPTTHRYEPWGAGLYAEEQIEQTYSELHRRASSLLQQGRAVILDASYRKAAWRRGARDLARQLGASFVALECVAPEAVLKRRLGNRLRRQGVPSDGRWELVRQQQAAFEPLTELAQEELIQVDTSGPAGETLSQALIELYRRLLAPRRQGVGA
jgi:hypothetical protein